jgi:hypothetical protein
VLHTDVELIPPKGKNRLRGFKNKVLRRLFGFERKYQDGGENYIMKNMVSFMPSLF